MESHPINREETKAEEAKRLREWLGKKAAYYCRAHGFRIIVFLEGIGGCKKCCDGLITKMLARAEARKDSQK